MAFLVETGEGLVASNSYITVAEFQAHHADRGIDVVDLTSTEIQAALVQATDYLDKRFGKRFRGYRRTREQALEWPRSDAYDNDEYLFSDVPGQLKKATAEYARIAYRIGRDLAPIPGVDFAVLDPETGGTSSEASGKIKSKTEKVGPIEESTEYDTSAANRPWRSTGNLSQNIPEYPQADMWVEELIRSGMSLEIRRG